MSLDKAKPKDTPVKNKPVDKPAPKPADRSQPKVSQTKDAGKDKSGGSKIDLNAIRNKMRDTQKRSTDQTQPQASATDKAPRKKGPRPSVDLKAVRARMRDGSKTGDQANAQSSDKTSRKKGARPNVDLKATRAKIRDVSKVKDDPVERDLKFKTVIDVQAVLNEALRASFETYNKYGVTRSQFNKWINQYSTGASVTRLNSQIARQVQPFVDRQIKSSNLDFTTQQRAALTGNLVHRVSELRTLRHHANDIVNGKRLVEHKIGEKGKELDLIVRRGNKHHIYDYKPVNLAQIETKSWYKDFKQWLNQTHDGDLSKIGNFRSMDSQLQRQFRDFVSHTVKEHRNQLEGYRNEYAKAYNVSPKQVESVVLPYFTWL